MASTRPFSTAPAKPPLALLLEAAGPSRRSIHHVASTVERDKPICSTVRFVVTVLKWHWEGRSLITPLASKGLQRDSAAAGRCDWLAEHRSSGSIHHVERRGRSGPQVVGREATLRHTALVRPETSRIIASAHIACSRAGQRPAFPD